VEIERLGNKMRVIIWTARPGMIIGKQGAEIERLREEIVKLLKNDYEVRIAIYEVKNPETDAQIVSDSIARQIERRVSYKRAMKQAISRAMRSGAQGIKIAVSGRLVELRSLAVNGSFRVNCLCPRLNPMWTMATVLP